MRARRWFLSLLITCLLLVNLSPDTKATDVCGNISNNSDLTPAVKLATLAAARCLGQDLDQTPVTGRVSALLASPPGEADARTTALSGLEHIKSHLLSAAALCRETTKDCPLDHVLGALEELGLLITSGGETPPINSWHFDPTSGMARFGWKNHSLKSFIDEHCPDADRCEAALGTAIETVRLVTLSQRILDYLNQPDLKRLLGENQARQARWESYFTRTRPQYLWEVLINGAWARHKDDRPREAVPRGYLQVPRSQWVLAHPDVGLEFIASAPDGNEAEAAAILELIGFNRWGKWKDDNTPGFQFGASAVLVASDRSATDDLGWGVVFHLDARYSAGAASHGGEVGFFISTNLSSLWARVDEQRRQVISERK